VRMALTSRASEARSPAVPGSIFTSSIVLSVPPRGMATPRAARLREDGLALRHLCGVCGLRIAALG
jgi:hypothetical protein